MDYEGFRKDAIAYAKARKLNKEEAEDFAQEYCARAFKYETEFIRMDWAFIDYLRESYGRTGTPGGDARIASKSREVRLDANRESTNPHSSLAHEYIGSASADPIDHIQRKKFEELISYFPERERRVIEMKLLGFNLKEIGQDLGVTESRASQLVSAIEERIVFLQLVGDETKKWIISNVF